MVFITVTEPQTETEGRKQQQKFTSYLVTTISEETAKKNQIRRRYSDFTWLYGRLQTEVPGAIVPIIPHERALFSEEKRLSVEFVERRRRDLQDFLVSVVAHPELSRAPSMTPFMVDQIGVEFTQGKKKVEDAFPTDVIVEDEPESTKQSKVLKGVSTMFARLMTSKEQLKETPEEKDIEKIKDYISKLENHIKPLVKSAETMTRLTGELAVTIGDIARPIGDWKTTYQTKELTGDQKLALHENPNHPSYNQNAQVDVVNMMAAIQEFSQDYSTLLLMKHKQEEESFERCLHILANYIKAFRLALKQRKQWQVAYTTTYQHVIDKEAAIAKATKTLKPPEVTGKLQDEKAVLEKRKVLEKQKLFQCSTRLVKEFATYQPKLEALLRSAFLEFATLQRSYTDRINDAWGQLLPYIQPPELESNGTADSTDNDNAMGNGGSIENGNDDETKQEDLKKEEEGSEDTFVNGVTDDDKKPAENGGEPTENGESRPPMPSSAPPSPP